MDSCNNYYVYMYLDQENVPFYIGKGRGKRAMCFAGHKVGYTATKIKSIGRENIKVYFLHKALTEEEAIRWERYWIKYLGRKDNDTGQLTNHTDGGEGMSGHTRPENIRRKISKALMGHPGANKGKQFSKKHRQKISKANQGHIVLEKTRQKISKAMEGNQNGKKF